VRLQERLNANCMERADRLLSITRECDL